MTNNKKGFAARAFAAFAVALAMVLAMAVTALAANTGNSITVNGDHADHTYEAYQVFKGDIHEGKLSNIEWGDNVNGTALLAALKADATFNTTANDDSTNRFKDCTTAAQVADVLSTNAFGDNGALTKAFAKVVGKNLTTAKYTLENTGNNVYKVNTGTADEPVYVNVEAGYYFIKDQDNSVANTDHDFYTDFILEVVGSAVADVKGQVPTSDKKVGDDHKTTDGDNNVTVKLSPEQGTNGKGYGVVAEYNIGDAVPFRLHGTVSSNIADYAYYQYQFVDNQGIGLDPVDESSVQVILVNPVYDGSNNVTGYTYFLLDGTTDYVVEKQTYTAPDLNPIDGKSSFTVSIGTNLNTAAAGDTPVYVRDVLGLAGHGTEVTWNNTTGAWEAVDGSTATAAIDKHTQFIVTYTATLNNEIGVGTDAFDPATNESHVVYSNNPNDGGSKGKTPDKETFVFSYEIEPTKTADDWNTETHALGGAGFVLYKKDANGVKSYAKWDNDGKITWTAMPDKFYEDNDNTKPELTGAALDAAKTAWIAANATEQTSDATTGKFHFTGLDVGTYYLQETTVPAGYNKIDDVTVTITATYKTKDATTGEQEIDTLKIVVEDGKSNSIARAETVDDTDKDQAQVEMTIKNKSGNTLPETGGIGTMIFTAVGATLMAGAGITFVVKKRNEASIEE